MIVVFLIAFESTQSKRGRLDKSGRGLMKPCHSHIGVRPRPRPRVRVVAVVGFVDAMGVVVIIVVVVVVLVIGRGGANHVDTMRPRVELRKQRKAARPSFSATFSSLLTNE